MYKNVLIIFLLFSVGFKYTAAQEMNGYVHSNYSGITGAQINPTSMVNSKLYFDLNLIGFHVNVDNDFIYLAKDEYKFTRFLSPTAEYPKHGEDNRIYYDHYNEKLKNAFTQVKILGPSVMFSKNDKAFGISTSVRNIVSGIDIPYEIAKFGAEGFDYTPLHRIRFVDNKDFRAGALSFAEISATYAQVIYKQNMDHLTAGITLKGLLGLGGAYFHVDNADYMLPNSDTLIVYNLNGKAGVSLPMDYHTGKSTFSNPLILGTGLGVDVGLTYQLKMKGHTNKRYTACEQPFEDYYYKLGISLLDIGYIKFKKNTRQLTMEDAQGTWYDFTHQNIETIDVLFGAVSSNFGADSTDLVNNDAFKVFLPAAASVQFDLRINKQMYVNASLVYPLLFNEYTIARPSQLSVTPRIEQDNFELALPITLYNFRYPRVGLSARFSKFIIGTDKLGSFFGLSHFTGLDLYFMVKLPLIKGHCLGRSRGHNCGNLEFRQYQRNQKELEID